MCFHFVLSVLSCPALTLAEFVANPSNPPTRTKKAQARQHQPLLGYLVSSQNTGVCCCFSCCETFVYWWSALAASQTRDWTALSDPCLLLSFFMPLCPGLPRRILPCLVSSCLSLL